MNSNEVRRIIMKRMIVSLVVFASMFVVWAVPNAQARDCSNASLQGGYGFLINADILPPLPFAGTPRAVLGRWAFDGKGNFTNTLIINDGGTVTPRFSDFGTYTVNADCTGKIFTNGNTRTIEIVLVDGGKEFFSLRTDDAHILFRFNVAKKQFPDDNDDNQER